MNFIIQYDKKVVHELHKLRHHDDLAATYLHLLQKLEQLGPRAGKLLDEHLHVYEVREKHPPLRLYFCLRLKYIMVSLEN